MENSLTNSNKIYQDKLHNIYLALKSFVKMANITTPFYITTHRKGIYITAKFKDTNVEFTCTSLQTMYNDSIVWIEEMDTLYKRNKYFMQPPPH